jgi:Xaa-Pro aminopeptidase
MRACLVPANSDGDLVLVDAGCELHHYASDITRTFPISGRFGAAQRDVYEAVLEVQQNCIQVGLHATRERERDIERDRE